MVEEFGWSPAYARAVLTVWKLRPSYCQAILRYPTRINLDGSPTGEDVDDAARATARAVSKSASRGGRSRRQGRKKRDCGRRLKRARKRKRRNPCQRSPTRHPNPPRRGERGFLAGDRRTRADGARAPCASCRGEGKDFRRLRRGVALIVKQDVKPRALRRNKRELIARGRYDHSCSLSRYASGAWT